MFFKKTLFIFSFLLLLPLIQNQAPAATTIALALETLVAPGTLQRPVDVAHAGDERLFIVERAGKIRIVKPGGAVLATPFLDIGDRVEWESNAERGLLGLAFHPGYGSNGYFYVNYTAVPDGATRISRFQVTADPDVADPASETVVLAVAQPYANHNAGDLAFGPADGYLYVPLGDGGSGNDPGNRAQDSGVLLGKLLRLDVDGGSAVAPDCGAPGNYTIPADNPFVDGEGGACDEIWALGLRNPWRFSFDRQTHALFIADVGQSSWEEINLQPAASTGGENYGWSCYEGTHLNGNTQMPSCEPASSYTMPIFEYENDGLGCAVTGGFIYRGTRYPALVGHYLLADYCTGNFWDLVETGGTWTATRHDNLQAFGFATFGEGADGEIYVANVSSGGLYHVADTSVGPLHLSIDDAGGGTVSLAWTTSADDCDYQLFHAGLAPDGNYTLLQTLPDVTTYDDTGIIGNGSNDYYYVAANCYDGAAAAISNRVGVFEFSLQPGT